jgi:N-acetylneuraminate synthase/N,N'-diacetyllegionaminate synthase
MLSIQKTLSTSWLFRSYSGIEVPIAAVAICYNYRETLTLDRTLQTRHVASLEPEELKAMVKAIRNIELALSGDGQKCQVTVNKKYR